MKFTLRDIDNRDESGAPFEFTGTVDEIAAYLDGPLRRDLTEDTGELDDAISALRAGDSKYAAGTLNTMLVHLTTAPVETQEGKQ